MKLTPPEIVVGTHFHVWYGTKVTLVYLLLMEKPLGHYFQVRSPYYQGATRKHLFLYPHGGRSGVRKPKKIRINVNQSYHQH